MLYQTLTVTPGSNLWCAPVCSTWVFLTLGLKNETLVTSPLKIAIWGHYHLWTTLFVHLLMQMHVNTHAYLAKTSTI